MSTVGFYSNSLIYTGYTYKIEKVSVCETSHHSEVGDENENPTIVGFCT
jgi:hypothetical protein